MSSAPSGNGEKTCTPLLVTTPHPKRDYSSTTDGLNLERNDLLRLVGVLEAELQARDIVISVLKTEHVKHLIYPVCGRMLRNGARNPVTNLWQDTVNAYEPYDHRVDIHDLRNIQQMNAKIAQKIIASNNELIAKAKERCTTECKCGIFQNAESLGSLLTKEAKEEADRVLEKETKASLVLEQERDRQKQIVLLLLNERQRLLQKLETARTNCQGLLQALRKEKLRNSEMVDGLEEESKRSLFMEEQMETASKQYSAHRLQCQAEVATLREENARQAAEVERLRAEIEKLSMASGAVRSQVVSSQSSAPSKLIPVLSPAQLAQRNVAEAPPVSKSVPGRPTDRPVPPPVPPNKPVILRKPAHLIAPPAPAAAAAAATTTAPVPAATPATAPSAAPNAAISVNASPATIAQAATTSIAQKSHPVQDPLDTEIKNFHSVLASMKAGPASSPSLSQPSQPQLQSQQAQDEGPPEAQADPTAAGRTSIRRQ